uniref:Uncharacterized protein n=1 Tax=Rhizophora mucronata TaxID=61149 RepID=A0A2P2QIC5_RHIMU
MLRNHSTQKFKLLGEV